LCLQGALEGASVAAMLKWIREVLASAGIVAGTVTAFAVSIALGVIIASKIGAWNPWLAAAVALGVLLLVILSVSVWWIGNQ